MTGELLIAANPDPDSRLPFLLWLAWARTAGLTVPARGPKIWQAWREHPT